MGRQEMSLLRTLLYLAISGALSWHFLLRPPADVEPVPVRPEPRLLDLSGTNTKSY